jgi:hypothetical protein
LDDFWADLLKREERFLASARPEFRHGAPFVSVSSLAEQYYCEYKVENEFAYGEVPTEAKERGTELHDELIPGVSVTADDFVGLVTKKEPSYAVLRVWGSVGGLRMVGMPDHIVWSAGKPIWLVELKTTRGDPAPLWEDQENQARVYGLLLDLMGLDCSRLRLAVVRVKAQELSEEERKLWLVEVSDALMAGKAGELESRKGGRMKVHEMVHDRRLAVRAVTAKAGYWTGAREPTSSTSAGKCRACEYSSVCEKSLAKSV